MASTIYNMYKVLSTKITNGYRDGVWKIVQSAPSRVAIEQQKKPAPMRRVHPHVVRRLVKRTEYGLPLVKRLHQRGHVNQSPKQERHVGIMSVKAGDVPAPWGLANPMRVDHLGIVPRWRKEVLLGAEVLAKQNPLEHTFFRKIVEAEIEKIPPHLTPESKAVITAHYRDFQRKEYLYICKSRLKTRDGKMLYKIGRSSDVAQRMKRHKSCNLGLYWVIQAHDSARLEKYIHTDLKSNPNVSHDLKKCPYCGTSHREMFSLPAGEEGERLLREVVGRHVYVDESLFRINQQFYSGYSLKRIRGNSWKAQ